MKADDKKTLITQALQALGATAKYKQLKEHIAAAVTAAGITEEVRINDCDIAAAKRALFGSATLRATRPQASPPDGTLSLEQLKLIKDFARSNGGLTHLSTRLQDVKSLVTFSDQFGGIHRLAELVELMKELAA